MNIFITGTESGIGNELAFKALQQGHTIFATYMMDKNIHRLAQQNSPRLFLHHLDVTDTAQIKRAVDIAREKLGVIDVLINVAGVSYYNTPQSTTDEEWMNTFNVNVNGYFFLTRELIPELKKSKHPHIINMSSVWGLQGNSKMFSYSVSKFAVEGLSRGMKE